MKIEGQVNKCLIEMIWTKQWKMRKIKELQKLLDNLIQILQIYKGTLFVLNITIKTNPIMQLILIIRKSKPLLKLYQKLPKKWKKDTIYLSFMDHKTKLLCNNCSNKFNKLVVKCLINMVKEL